MMFEPCVEMIDIMELVGDFKRPYIEGSAVLKAKHIVECGVLKNTPSVLEIVALCLQTSKLNEIPHEIRIKINNIGTNKLVCGTCTCKAGTGKCKHVVAVCMYLNRIPLEDLQDLSCTDLMQQWGKIKNEVKATYNPQPMSSFCHVDKKLDIEGIIQVPITGEIRKQILNNLLEGAPESGLAVHKRERRKPVCLESSSFSPPSEKLRSEITDLLLAENPFMLNSKFLDNELLLECSAESRMFYSKTVELTIGEAVSICLQSSAQNDDFWHSHRRRRITGSACYALYTYIKSKSIKQDWHKKINNIVNPSFKGNANTAFGKANEEAALKSYMKQCHCHVEKIGIIINCLIPWLGYSPDGIDFKNSKLIEIKCLTAGQMHEGMDLVKQAGCVDIVGENIFLKKRHKFYGQIQLGLLLTGFKVCDFILKYIQKQQIIALLFL